MKQFLVFQGPVSSRSGYGDHARDLVKSLIAMDKYEIKIIDLRWGDCPRNGLSKNDKHLEQLFAAPQGITKQPDIFMQISVPNEFTPYGKYNIGITAGIETDAVAAPWIEGMNRMDMVIVPSNHAKNVFLNTKYDKLDDRTKQKVGELKCVKPIEVLFEGLDLEIYNKTSKIEKTLDETLRGIKEDFCYLYVGHWLQGARGHDRKDTGMMVKTFIETFKNHPSRTRPALIMKTSMATFSVIDQSDVLKRINKIRAEYAGQNIPNIYLIHGDLTPDEMNSLNNHKKVKAMISFTHGEGFGRPLLEFSITGKPVVAPNWSGQVDFLSPHSILLPGELKETHPSVHWKDVIIPQSKWFYVNYGYASKVLREIFKNYSTFLDNSKKQARYSKDNFSLEKMTEGFKSILDKYVVQEVSINLPQQNKINIEKPKSIKLPKLKKIEA